MRHPILFHLALVTAGSPTLLNAQGFHRNLPIGHATVSRCEAASDGGVFAYFGGHPQRPLMKLNSQGDLLWAKSIVTATGIVPDPNGGVIVLRPTDGIPVPPGSSYNPMLLQWLNADGEMLMNKRLTTTNSFWGDGHERLNAYAWTSTGELYLSITVDEDQVWVLKLDASGALLWSNHIGDLDETGNRLTVLPDGGVILMATNTFGLGWEKAARISATGELIWKRIFSLNAPAFYGIGVANLVDDAGNLLIAFSASSAQPGGSMPWLVVGKMDVDANMVWTYAYRREPGDAMTALGPVLSNSRTARQLDNGNYYFGSASGFEITPAGLFIRERACTSPTLAPGVDNISHSFTTRPTADGWLQNGLRTWTDPLFGNTLQMPLLGLTPMALDSTCFWTCDERTDIIAEPPPPEIISAGPGGTAMNVRTVNTEDWPVETLADVTMDLLEDACELPEIVLFQTSVEELEAVATLLLFPNPVVAGQPIQLDAEGPLVLEVLDARGRLVASQQYGMQPATLGTADWDAGLYLLRATRPNGQVVGMGRVVVH
jgi:hypothetical protein